MCVTQLFSERKEFWTETHKKEIIWAADGSRNMTAKSEDFQSEYFSDPEELKDEQEKGFFSKCKSEFLA